MDDIRDSPGGERVDSTSPLLEPEPVVAGKGYDREGDRANAAVRRASFFSGSASSVVQRETRQLQYVNVRLFSSLPLIVLSHNADTSALPGHGPEVRPRTERRRGWEGIELRVYCICHGRMVPWGERLRGHFGPLRSNLSRDLSTLFWAITRYVIIPAHSIRNAHSRSSERA